MKAPLGVSELVLSVKFQSLTFVPEGPEFPRAESADEARRAAKLLRDCARQKSIGTKKQ
jgi:hypothetical protein